MQESTLSTRSERHKINNMQTRLAVAAAPGLSTVVNNISARGSADKHGYVLCERKGGHVLVRDGNGVSADPALLLCKASPNAPGAGPS